ncbi:MAG: glycosyltransferase [Prosthecobacter sp.]|jgi:glycosyltransferase involved in cell wall biosynthesis|uniref:glycosyltransferase n=1 Tax=Prosthecobacter sp. TaxID=1965333 RepID=UPI0019F4A5AC|nr:glycosyltransferase [Prosthecobacter sp.]MBE2286423.1 glycosyltransferase [Prosthecobacter sp.]
MPTPTQSPTHAEGASKRDFIVFGPDWDRHPSTIQHLARCLLDATQVIWVETVGLRSPAFTWRDLKRSGQKLADFATTRRELSRPDHPNLHILSPVTLPFTQFRLVREFNLRSVQRRLRWLNLAAKLNNPVLVLSCPHQVDYIGHLRESRSVYFGMDDYSLWLGMNSAQVLKMEEEMLRRVDGVVTVSDHLARHLDRHGKKIRVITQGVDLSHFTLPPVRQARTGIEIVYFGMIDDRLDQQLLLQVSREFPDATLRLIGPQSLEPRLLKQCRNIRIEPGVPYSRLPEAIATADLFILPFAVNPLTESCTPLKLKEYLATGRPVVSTMNPTVMHWSEHVKVASNHDEFIGHLRTALAAPQPGAELERLRQRLAGETWESKAAEFLSFVNEL